MLFRKLTILIACIGMSIFCARADVTEQPDSFVSVSHVIPQLLFDIHYYSANNFVGEPVEGYLAPECLLHKDAAQALKQAYKHASRLGLNFKIFDCYRPQRAVDHFVRWAADLNDIKTKHAYYPNLDKSVLIGPYIAPRSGHSRGATVDLTLVKQVGEQWVELDMGTVFDFFDPISNTDNPTIVGEQRDNRQLLKHIMESAGFSAYDMEWWHFSLTQQPFPDTYFDFPVK